MSELNPIYVPPLDPLGLPSGPLWFVVPMHATLLLHFLFMNAVLGGTLVSLPLNVAHTGGIALAGHVARILHQLVPVCLSLAITFGVAPLLFVQVLYGPFFYTSTTLLGPVWMLLLVFLLAGFYLVYWLAYRGSNAVVGRAGPWDDRPLRRLAVAAVASGCFLAVAWIFTNNHVLSLHPDRWPLHGAWKIGRWHVAVPMVVPRYLHNMVGAVAVAALWIVGIGWWRRRRRVDDDATSAATILLGLRIALMAVLMQVALGIVFYYTLDSSVRSDLRGFHTFQGGVWTVVTHAVVPATLVGLWWATRRPSSGWRSLLPALGMGGIAIGMVLGREQVRWSYLARLAEPHAFELSDWPIHPQPSARLAFLMCFALALITVAILVVWANRAAPPPTSTDASAPREASPNPE